MSPDRPGPSEARLTATSPVRLPVGDAVEAGAHPYAIRPVGPHEYGALGQLLVDAYDGIPGAVVDPDYNAILRDVGRRVAQASVLVAVDSSGAVLGGATYAVGGGRLANLAEGAEAEIRMLAVAPHSRGRGVGRALAEACIRRARAEGRGRLWLETSPWMTDAQALYRRLGFARVPDRDRVEVSSGAAFELWAYCLEL